MWEGEFTDCWRFVECAKARRAWWLLLPARRLIQSLPQQTRDQGQTMTPRSPCRISTINSLLLFCPTFCCKALIILNSKIRYSRKSHFCIFWGAWVCRTSILHVFCSFSWNLLKWFGVSFKGFHHLVDNPPLLYLTTSDIYWISAWLR